MLRVINFQLWRITDNEEQFVIQLCIHQELDRIKFNIIIKFSGGYKGTTRVLTAPVNTFVASYDSSTSAMENKDHVMQLRVYQEHQ